jgi:hypothetical protein
MPIVDGGNNATTEDVLSNAMAPIASSVVFKDDEEDRSHRPLFGGCE